MWDGEDTKSQIPMGVILTTKSAAGDRLLFLHPGVSDDSNLSHMESVDSRTENESRSKMAHLSTPAQSSQPPILMTFQNIEKSGEISFPTQFGLSSNMLANILSVKDSSCDQPFEMKIDNVRFVGFPKKVSPFFPSTALQMSETIEIDVFSIVFILPSNVDSHLVESFQMLSKKLATAIDALQTLHGYLIDQCEIMRSVLDEIEHAISKTECNSLQCQDPWEKVGFCIQSRALSHAHLTPKNRSEIDRIVKMIRFAYYKISIIFVYMMLKCTKVFLIVRHLLLWARAVVIYPLCKTNVYTSATVPKPLGKQIDRFSDMFGSSFHMAAALAQFNPPASLGSFVDSRLPLADQKTRRNVVVALLKYQLIMQLHEFCYVLAPYSDADLPRSGRHCPDSLKSQILACDGLAKDVCPIVSDICGQMLETMSYSKVEQRLKLFLRMAPLMNGMHHLEDIIYRLNEVYKAERKVINSVIESFEVVISKFLRPDFIAE
uniref:GATOR complex protein NPRL3 n=1 Tax=Heterorhabditis bacteriophora TaxID=37862 RepID=A0A1I7X7U4_HETBA